MTNTTMSGVFVRRPYLALVLNLLIIIGGLAAILGVEVRELPDVDRPVVAVRANYPGASPETLDSEVTAIVEAAVGRVNGVKHIRSSSEENNFRIRIEFRPDIDLIDAANDVREAVSRVERQLPEEVEDITVIKSDADANPILQLSVSSDTLRVPEITRIVEDEIVPALTSVSGVADVRVSGKQERVMRVVIDPMRLTAYGLAVSDVITVLKTARFDIPAGSFESQDQEIIVRADASVTSPAAVEALIIRDPVKIGDVAYAHFSPADPQNYVRVNGSPVINLGIIRRAQSNTVQISDDVQRAAQLLQKRLKDVKIDVTSDDAVFIRGAIREVLWSLSIAVAIVVAILALFLGRASVALIPAVAIPVALIGTVSAIWLMGFSINLVTLLALVLAAGLVVDDAIVVLENIQRLEREGNPPAKAAVIGTDQVYFAVLATTATLVSVFVPISFLPSSAGRLFAEFGFVLATAIMISSFVALSLCPMLASRIKIVSKNDKTTGPLGALGRILQNAYAAILNLVLAMPWAFLALCIFLAASSAIIYEQLGEELVPKEDRGKIIIRLTGPDGTGLNYIDRQVEKVEEILRPLQEKGLIENISSISGRGDPNRGWVEARLIDWSSRDQSELQIGKSLRKKFEEIPGAQVRVQQGNSLNLRGASGGITFAITGADYDKIFTATKLFVRKMEQEIPQLENFRVEFRATQPQISLHIDRRRASDLGISVEALSSTVEALVDKRDIGDLVVDDQTIPIIVQASNGAINDPSDLSTLFIRNDQGRLISLDQLITFEEKAVAAELDRHGQRRAIEIRADRVGDVSLRTTVDAVRTLALKELPKNTGILMLDEAAALEENSKGVAVTYIAAFVIVFLVLVAQFESISSALIVMFTVPFGICAAIIALGLSGTSINIYSQIGVLMLIGIMAKNAILMVEFADQLLQQGLEFKEAARQASLVRLRPICMTMISTILAGTPLILSVGPGAESRAAIGWVVIGGLGLASTFTLFLTPALYAIIAPLTKARPDDTATDNEPIRNDPTATPQKSATV